MKRRNAEYPYDQYWLYIVFHRKEGRNYANLIPKDPTKNKRKTISYARYLMCVKEKRILQDHEHVDHKDNDKTNDDISNLQILTISENNKKESRRRGGRALIELQCPNCNKIFIRPKNQTQLQQPKKYTCCSRHCSATLSYKLQKNPNDTTIQKAISQNIIRELRSTNI